MSCRITRLLFDHNIDVSFNSLYKSCCVIQCQKWKMEKYFKSGIYILIYSEWKLLLRLLCKIKSDSDKKLLVLKILNKIALKLTKTYLLVHFYSNDNVVAKMSRVVSFWKSLSFSRICTECACLNLIRDWSIKKMILGCNLFRLI